MTSESDSSPDPADANPALRARVPDHVAEGCFSTGAIVMTGPSEFIIDFLQTIGRPHRVASRVVIPHPVMPQFIDALQTNLDLYRNRFGDPPSPPANPQQNQPRRPTPQEIYDDLKMPDHVLSGVYANGVMIGHGASEFGLDFLTSFFPQSAVSSRVFVAAGQVPRLLDSLKGAVRQLEQRRQQQSENQTNFPGMGIDPANGPSDPGGNPNSSDLGADGGQRHDGTSGENQNPDSSSGGPPSDNDTPGGDSEPKI